MQIAFLFIYNHCQVLNNIYLQSISSLLSPFSSVIPRDNRQLKKVYAGLTRGRASEASRARDEAQKSAFPYPSTFRYRKLKFLFSPKKKKAERWDKTSSRYQLYRSLFILVSVGSLGSFFFIFWINFSTHKVKKLANIGDDYVHCVTDE